MQLFGGFSFDDAEARMYGWQASGARNLTRNLGLVADFGGHYDSVSGIDVQTHQFLFGPRYRSRESRWVGFGHVLGGLQRVGVSGLGSENALGLGLGGGLDLMTERGFGFRVMQLDWMPAHNGGDWTTDQYRAGFGLILPVGR